MTSSAMVQRCPDGRRGVMLLCEEIWLIAGSLSTGMKREVRVER